MPMPIPMMVGPPKSLSGSGSNINMEDRASIPIPVD
jgi:hypothetical protein